MAKAKAKSQKSNGIRRMAERESRSEWSERRVNKMFDIAAKPKNKSPTKKSMADKVPGKMGPSTRNGVEDPKTRKDDKATRGRKMREHFKNILSGKSGRMQGKK